MGGWRPIPPRIGLMKKQKPANSNSRFPVLTQVCKLIPGHMVPKLV